MLILILAGGTGGHIFPAISVAKRLVELGHTIHWLGTRNGLESKIVPQHGFPINYINIVGIRGSSWYNKLLLPIRLVISLIQSIKYLLILKPDMVLGMGGFVSGPAGLASWLLGKKLIIHEQNAIAGTTNKILAKFSHTVLAAFPNSFPVNHKSRHKVQIIGNPVRKEFFDLTPPIIRFATRSRQQPLRLLVLGGSRGALSLNNIVPMMLENWDYDYPLEIKHQTGVVHFDATEKLYEQIDGKNNIKFQIFSFIENMPIAYEWADIVLCRAGALTIAELSAVGVASILIPFPHAIDDHQTVNGLHLANAEAAILIPQNLLTVNKLKTILLDLYNNRDKLFFMANQAYQLANTHKNAVDKIIEYCIL